MPGFSDDDITRTARARLAALNSALANAMAEEKLCGSQIDELERKISAGESRLASGSASPTSAMVLQSQVDMNKQELADVRQRLASAQMEIPRLKTAIAQLPAQTKGLLVSNRIADMQETLAGIASPFESGDPSAAIDEMRSKIASRSGKSAIDPGEYDLAEADAKLKQSEVDDLLARYKQEVDGTTGRQPSTSIQKPVSLKESDVKTLAPSEKDLPPVD